MGLLEGKMEGIPRLWDQAMKMGGAGGRQLPLATRRAPLEQMDEDQATAGFFSFCIVILGAGLICGTGSPCSLRIAMCPLIPHPAL